MSIQIQTKTVVTVREMASMCGLSRARFYQLQEAGVFPMPVYDVATRRPLFTEEMQLVCLEVRRRNCGINGKPVLFYARRFASVPIKPRVRPAVAPKKDVAELLAKVKSFGDETVTAAQVHAAVNELFSSGTTGKDQWEVAREVFMHIRGQNSADKVGK